MVIRPLSWNTRPKTKDIRLITEFEDDDQLAHGKDRIHPKNGSHSEGTHPGNQGLPWATDQPSPINLIQFPIQYQDVQLKDRRWVEFLKSPSTPKTESKKISLKEYLNHKPTQVTPLTITDELPGDDSIWELSLSTPSIEWEHMVDQLNQDPQANSIADSGRGMAIMEKSGADVVGDEEVEVRNEGLTTGAAVDVGAGNLVFDPQDPLFEFNDENSGMTQTPVAALMPVVMPVEDEMPNLE